LQEDLKGALGAHHHTVLAEGSGLVQGTAKGSGLPRGIRGNGLAQGNAEGKGLAPGTEGTGLAQGTAEGTRAQGTAGGSAHAQGTREGVEIGPGHRLAMGTIRQTRKHFPCDGPFRLRASRDCVNN
jgi:hypothetical protein